MYSERLQVLLLQFKTKIEEWSDGFQKDVYVLKGLQGNWADSEMPIGKQLMISVRLQCSRTFLYNDISDRRWVCWIPPRNFIEIMISIPPVRSSRVRTKVNPILMWLKLLVDHAAIISCMSKMWIVSNRLESSRTNPVVMSMRLYPDHQQGLRPMDDGIVGKASRTLSLSHCI